VTSDRKTTAFQERVITALARALPTATLTGGAALAAFHTKQRATRDIDIFFHGVPKLDPIDVRTARDAVGEFAERVASLHSGASFTRFEADSGTERVVVDLVASPVPVVEHPERRDLLGVSVQVDSAREILVNKVVALLSRSELRDLVDVRALVASGGSLTDAVAQAPQKDAGFSPLTLAWVLRGFPVEKLARLEGAPESDVAALASFRDELVEFLLGSLPE
jgi:hypothetical protein